jgi:hypothetical protein
LIQVQIAKGFHRGQEVSGLFTLIKPFTESGGGEGSITVSDVNNLVPWKMTNPIRVKLNQAAFQLLDAGGGELAAHIVVDTADSGKMAVSTNYEQAYILAETEDEAMDRIQETFLNLDSFTDWCAKGTVRGLVVSGPPGIGKSFGVEKQLETANMFRKIEGKDPLYEIVTGGVSPIGLYQKLYHNRNSKQVICFDDCDGLLFEEECLSLLKGALNSGDKRRIAWNKESRVLAVEDIPEVFDFDGSIIFLSNIDFERTSQRASRISEHLKAIMSRCHYLDLEIGSTRDKLLRIKQVVRDGMLNVYDFTSQQEADLLDFIFSNSEHLRELSLRQVKKIADLVKADPVGWAQMAEATCLHREAKFKRLLAKRAEAAARGVVLAEQV